MPLESATYLNNLVPSNPASTDTVSQADDHIRLIKQVLRSTFPNINAPVTATPAQLNSAVPAGFIGMWSGSLATIPAGWGLCDGAGGRPDLRNRFIVGAGLGYAVGVTGGADVVILSEANLPAHAHPASASGSSDDVNLVHSHPFSGSSGTGGSHNHSYFVSDYSNFGGDELFPGSNYTAERLPTVTSDHTGHTHPISGTVGDALGNHSHPITVSVTVDATGSNAAHENRPPFYALAFIIKL